MALVTYVEAQRFSLELLQLTSDMRSFDELMWLEGQEALQQNLHRTGPNVVEIRGLLTSPPRILVLSYEWVADTIVEFVKAEARVAPSAS